MSKVHFYFWQKTSFEQSQSHTSCPTRARRCPPWCWPGGWWGGPGETWWPGPVTGPVSPAPSPGSSPVLLSGRKVVKRRIMTPWWITNSAQLSALIYTFRSVTASPRWRSPLRWPDQLLDDCEGGHVDMVLVVDVVLEERRGESVEVLTTPVLFCRPCYTALSHCWSPLKKWPWSGSVWRWWRGSHSRPLSPPLDWRTSQRKDRWACHERWPAVLVCESWWDHQERREGMSLRFGWEYTDIGLVSEATTQN